jgi:endonuclease/exonuclease/phosphatase family metal-dependent hydrolase
MVQLKDFKTGKTFAIFNAHLAFSEIDKREAEAQFIANLLSEYQQRMPVILTGDLNTFPNRPDLIRLPAYDGDRVEQILAGSLKDAQKAAILGSIGPLSTFTNDPLDLEIKPFRGRGTPGVILDHIFVSDSVQVLLFAIQPGTIDGHFPSDHMPIIADCWLN